MDDIYFQPCGVCAPQEGRKPVQMLTMCVSLIPLPRLGGRCSSSELLVCWDGAAGAAKRLKGSSTAVLLLPELLACPGRSLGSKAAALSCFGGLLANTCTSRELEGSLTQAAKFHIPLRRRYLSRPM